MSQEHGHEFKPYGELEYCHICMGFEGSMPTDCPKERMTSEQSDAVYAGNLDYRDGEGWVNKLSPMGQSTVKSKIFDMLRQREGCHKSDAEIIISVGTTKEEYNKMKQDCLRHIYQSSI